MYKYLKEQSATEKKITLSQQRRIYNKYIARYELILNEIGQNLNRYLKYNYSNEFWRINIGPYLQDILGKFFILYNYNISNKDGTCLYIDKQDKFIDTKHFFNFIDSIEGENYLKTKLFKSHKKKKISNTNL